MNKTQQAAFSPRFSSTKNQNVAKKKQEVKHATFSTIGLVLSGKDAPKVIEAINAQLHQFASTEGKCPKCGALLTGMLGSFRWGVVYGGGPFDKRRCVWPCRGVHDLKDPDGEALFDGVVPVVLAYHPDFVKRGNKVVSRNELSTT